MKRAPHLAKLLLLVPLGLGVYGLVFLAGQPFWDSLYLTVSMYALNYADTPPNIFVELARWTAPLATASSVILAVRSLQRWLSARCRGLFGDSVAVYGPERERLVLLDQLGRRGVNGEDGRLLPAARYVLLGGETENFAFYRAHADALRRRRVYLKCASLPAQSVADAGLTLFCPEELAARLYWRQRQLSRLWQGPGQAMRIVLLGFGELGEQLLVHGLQNNLFDPAQRLEYHVFGDCAEFLATHPSLSQIEDPVIPHSERWYEALPLVEQADLVLVLTQQEQTALLQELLAVTTRRQIDVFSAGEPALALLAQKDRLAVFDWQREALRPELLFEDVMYERAMRINLRYCHLYDGVEETDENCRTQWEKLDAFTRGSNISAADYHEMRLRMMEEEGLSPDGGLSSDALEKLAELEHIRWCRYHFLNNWRFGTPENGRNKDPQRRIHTLLVPYRDLPEAEKEKDRENIRVMLAIR